MVVIGATSSRSHHERVSFMISPMGASLGGTF
jgi:hypothetical protein